MQNFKIFAVGELADRDFPLRIRTPKALREVRGVEARALHIAASDRARICTQMKWGNERMTKDTLSADEYYVELARVLFPSATIERDAELHCKQIDQAKEVFFS